MLRFLLGEGEIGAEGFGAKLASSVVETSLHKDEVATLLLDAGA